MKAQVMCSKFNPQTLVAISAAEQLSDVDKSKVYLMTPPQAGPDGKPTPPQPVPGPDGKPLPAGPAMALLVGQERLQNPEAESPNPLRAFRIDVNADSMIQMNEGQEKQDRMEFLTANATFMEKATMMTASAGQAAPIIVPLIMEMWKFGVTGFKVGKTIEGQFDEATEKLKAAAAKPQQPKPDPEMMKVQAQQQADAQRLKHDQQMAVMEHQQAQSESQLTMQREQQASQEKIALDAQAKTIEDAMHAREISEKYAFERWKVQEDNNTKITVAEIGREAQLDSVLGKTDDTGKTEMKESNGASRPKRESPIDKLAKMHGENIQAMASQLQAHVDAIGLLAHRLSAPRETELIRDPVTGRAQKSVTKISGFN